MNPTLEKLLEADFFYSEYQGNKCYEVFFRSGPGTDTRAWFDDKYYYPSRTNKIQLSKKNYKILLDKVVKARETYSIRKELDLMRDLIVPSKAVIYYFVYEGLFIALPAQITDASVFHNLNIMADAVFTSNGKVHKMRGESLREAIQVALDNEFKNVTLLKFEDGQEALDSIDKHLFAYNAIRKFNSICTDLGQNPKTF